MPLHKNAARGRDQDHTVFYDTLKKCPFFPIFNYPDLHLSDPLCIIKLTTKEKEK